MLILPIEVWQLILELCSLPTQLNLTVACKLFNHRLHIIDFNNIENEYKHKLTNDILKRYQHLKHLDASDNLKISNQGIKHLNLDTLNAENNDRITDRGLRHLKLTYLDASNNNFITDEGIKHMDLQVLFASGYSCKITDQGMVVTPPNI